MEYNIYKCFQTVQPVEPKITLHRPKMSHIHLKYKKGPPYLTEAQNRQTKLWPFALLEAATWASESGVSDLLDAHPAHLRMEVPGTFQSPLHSGPHSVKRQSVKTAATQPLALSFPLTANKAGGLLKSISMTKVTGAKPPAASLH